MSCTVEYFSKLYFTALNSTRLDCTEAFFTVPLFCVPFCPCQVQVYSVETVRFQLQVAASWYLGKFVDLSQPNKVTLPKLLQWYGKDLAPSTPRLLEWIASHCPDAKVRGCALHT